MKLPVPKSDKGGEVGTAAQLRAMRHAQRETSHRIEELRLKVMRFTEQHMDQTVRLIKRWLKDSD